MNFIGILCLILISTSLAGHYSARLNFPPVIGQLMIGLLLGPAILGIIKTNSLIHVFSEIGVIILMFIGGLESNLSLLKKFLKPSIIVAVSGIVLPFISTYFIGLVFGLNQIESLFIGIIFIATSVSISVEVLKSMKYLQTPEGTTILGAAVVDDILSIIILSVLISLSVNTTGSSQPSIFLTIVEQLIFFILIFVASRWLVPKLIKISSKLLLPVPETIMSMILCFGSAYFAEKMGLSGAIGAFFAGLAISQTPQKKEIIDKTNPIGYAIFIPVFFVSIGLSISLLGIVENSWLFITLIIVGILSKWLGAGGGALLAKFNYKNSSVIGAGMISRGEMALIIAQIGFNAHLLSSGDYSVIIGSIVVITIFAPFILNIQIKKLKNSISN